MSNIQVGIQVVIMFFILVSIHEWGHFYFAKRAGILVREFAIGFGPKLFSYKRGETRYTLRLLPVGGFVRMAGEDPEIVEVQSGQTIAVRTQNNEVTHLFLDKLDQRTGVLQGVVEKIDLEKQLFVILDVEGESVKLPIHPQAMMVTRGRETQIAPFNRQFGSKTVGQRALSIVMGPVMNFLLAIVLFFAFMFMAGVAKNVKLGELTPGEAAEKAGLKKGDIIVSINNEQVGASNVKVRELIGASGGKPMLWIIERGGEQMQKEVTPGVKEGTGFVGIQIDSDKRKPTMGEAIKGTYENTITASTQILIGFKRLVFGQFKMDDLGGPVRIVEVTSEYASYGLPYLTFWTALLSLYLGLFNLLPFPALDGSRLLFLFFEALRGRPVDPNRESLVHLIGFAMLMLLMIAVTYNDILRLISG